MTFTPNYTIAGKRIFNSEEDMNTHLPDDNVKRKFSEIVSIVNNIDNFNHISKLDFILKLDMNGLSSDDKSKVQNFFKNSKLTDFCLPTQPSDNHLFNWTHLVQPTMTNDLSKSILSTMQSDIDNLDSSNVNPLHHGTHIESYKEVIRNLCTTIFEHKYKSLQVQYTDSLPSLSRDRIMSMTEKLCEFVTTNANRDKTQFNKNCDDAEGLVDSYFKSVFTIVLNQKQYTSSDLTNKHILKIFVFCFYPYFLFEFILNNIAGPEITSLSNAPRSFFVQRISVLASYMFLFYTVSTIEESMASSGLQKEYQKSLQIMAKINDELFQREKLGIDTNSQYSNLSKNTNNTREMSKDLQMANSNLSSAKNNLNKVALNDTLMNPAYKKSFVYKYIWLSILILCIVLSLVSLLFLQSQNIVYVTGLVIFIIIIITWVIQFFQKMKSV